MTNGTFPKAAGFRFLLVWERANRILLASRRPLKKSKNLDESPLMMEVTQPRMT